MKTLVQLIDLVGQERWKTACDEAVAYSSSADRIFRATPPASFDLVPLHSNARLVPHEIEEFIWDCRAAWEDKFDLFARIYDEMPSTAHLTYLTHHLVEFAEPLRAKVWQWAEAALNATPAHANPVEYWLWSDVFESGTEPERVSLAAEAFQSLTGPAVSDAGLKRVLKSSGPVPFAWKVCLYERLLPVQAWHPWILESLLASLIDVYGQIEPGAALPIAETLTVPSRTDVQRALVHALSSSPVEVTPQLSAALRRGRVDRESRGDAT